MLKYSGIVESVIFRNEDNGYSVLSVKPDDGRSFTAVGTIPFADQGDRLSLEGEWTEHSAYGSQFKVASFSFCAPEGRDALEKRLRLKNEAEEVGSGGGKRLFSWLAAVVTLAFICFAIWLGSLVLNYYHEKRMEDRQPESIHVEVQWDR